ncbi:MAG: hypothetical protein P4L33_19975 [Capsulimonadaceae bacterium]|nr:hypothetical protein [Capsulimonadaceae bacterium]
MRLQIDLAALLAIALASTGSYAYADIKVVQSTTIDWSHAKFMGQPVTGDMSAMLKSNPFANGGASNSVTYSSGNLTRTDTPIMSIIMDSKAKTETILLPASKTYYVIPLPGSPAKASEGGTKGGKDTATASPFAGMMKNVKSKYVDGKEKTTLLGHPVHLYLMSMSVPSMKMTMNARLWIAADLPSIAAASACPGCTTGLSGTSNQFKGLPLKMTMTMSMKGIIDHMVAVTQVTSLSTDPIAASVFTAPADYTKTDKMPAPGISKPTPPATSSTPTNQAPAASTTPPAPDSSSPSAKP